MGKHPVSTTIRMEVNRELEEMCTGIGCSKYAFIEEAIKEKMEKTKIERKEIKRGSAGENNSAGEASDRVEGEPVNDID